MQNRTFFPAVVPGFPTIISHICSLLVPLSQAVSELALLAHILPLTNSEMAMERLQYKKLFHVPVAVLSGRWEGGGL